MMINKIVCQEKYFNEALLRHYKPRRHADYYIMAQQLVQQLRYATYDIQVKVFCSTL